ncbi:MAG: hypothetical protein ACQEP9_00665 [Bacillota bacterium]
MGMLRVDHPDILDFINAKGELTTENQELYDEFKSSLVESDFKEAKIEQKLEGYKRKLLDNQFSNFNLSVGVTDQFMAAVEADEEYDLINPRTGEQVEQLNARHVFDLIVDYAWQNGEPGIVYLDEVNQKHPINREIEATNPCGVVRLM